MPRLEPLTPQQGLDLYFDTRESELAQKTQINQRYRLESFIEYLEEQDITNLNDVTGRTIYQFYQWRKNGEGERYESISTVTLKGIMDSLIQFLRHMENIDAVEPGLSAKVMKPRVEPSEEVSEEKIEPDRITQILEHLDRYHYASRDHVIIAILWHTGMRLGSLRALDTTDFHLKENHSHNGYPAYLTLRHRPDKGTALKNKENAERNINIGEYYAEAIKDYIEHNRIKVTDEHGRQPLISSKQGRLTEAPIRTTCYQRTQPCEYQSCPHNEEPESCIWRNNTSKSGGCPSARSPHAIRTGSITHHLNTGTPPEIVSERCDVTPDVLDQHYDMRTQTEKMNLRGEYLEI